MNLFYEVFTWLNIFEGSRLTRPDRILLEVITNKISKGKFSEAYRVIEYLKSYEHTIEREKGFRKGEIWVECSLAYYDMRYLFEAAKSLKEAERLYPAASHQHAVACCMLGTIQWDIENEYAEALLSWEDAIEDFEYLVGEAEANTVGKKYLEEKQDWLKRKKWYFERKMQLKNCLQEKIFETFS